MVDKPQMKSEDEDFVLKALGLQPDVVAKPRPGPIVVQGTRIDARKSKEDEDFVLKALGLDAPGSTSIAPSDIKNVPTSKDDPYYRGAVPVNQDILEARKGASKYIDPSQITAFTSGAIKGVPIAGPTLLSGVQQLAAGGNPNRLMQIQDQTNLAQSQNPGTALAGELAGGVLGYGAIASAAPAVVGGVGSTLGQRALSSIPGNALIGAGDAAARNGGDPAAMAQGALVGGIAGAGGPYVGALGQRIGAGIKGAFEPFTAKGQSAIADRYLGKMAQGGPLNPDLATYVPGSLPTMAQATANPGLATAERIASNVRPNAFVEREQQNAAARVNAVNALRGDEASLEALRVQRSSQADPVREAAFLNAQPTNPRNVVDKIDEILASPAGQRDVVVSALGNLRKKIIIQPEIRNPDGSIKQSEILQDDPKQLYGIRQALTDMLSPLSKGTESNKQLASKELMDIKKELDSAIESGASGYKHYLSLFSDASKPIDEQNFLQKANIFDTKGNVQLGPIDRLLNTIRKARMANGTNEAKNIADTTITELEAIRKDLLRQQNTLLGKAKGSDTFQNLAGANVANQMSVPVGLSEFLQSRPFSAIPMYLLKKAYTSKNEAVMDEVVNKLLSPTPPTSKAFMQSYNPALAAPSIGSLNQLSVPAIVSAINNRNRLVGTSE